MSPPASVGSVNATRSHGSIEVTWDAPTGATKYHVTYTTDGGNSWMLLASAHTGTSISIVNAANDKAYMVGVRAGNDGGWSGWVNSNEVPKVTPPPGNVSNVSATHNGGSVSVTWDLADHATGYDVVYSADGKAQLDPRRHQPRRHRLHAEQRGQPTGLRLRRPRRQRQRRQRLDQLGTGIAQRERVGDATQPSTMMAGASLRPAPASQRNAPAQRGAAISAKDGTASPDG